MELEKSKLSQEITKMLEGLGDRIAVEQPGPMEQDPLAKIDFRIPADLQDILLNGGPFKLRSDTGDYFVLGGDLDDLQRWLPRAAPDVDAYSPTEPEIRALPFLFHGNSAWNHAYLIDESGCA